MDILKLEAWYLKNHRKLPFRETKNPYLIWISEIMLQQTQVEAVLPFFESFIIKYPNIEDLAKIDEDTLHKDVEGMGYYRRFRNMQKAAVMVINQCNGVFPNTYEELLKLPGIGNYTAGAIMSIAYNQPYSALDGNVVRVLTRYLGIGDDMRIEKNKKKLNVINQNYIEHARPNLYTQAMMELGATICRPRNPKCDICPISRQCYAFNHLVQEEYPVLSKLKSKKDFNYITLIIEDHANYYLRKRDESLLFGMYEYPQFLHESIVSVIDELEEQNIQIEVLKGPTLYHHIFTHQIWHMEVYNVRLISAPLLSWSRVKKDQLGDIPMAISHRKIQ